MNKFKFKISWNGRTKTLKLADSQSVTFKRFTRNSEGWDLVVEEYVRVNDIIHNHVLVKGRDCDGPITEYVEYTVHRNNLRAVPRDNSKRGYWPAWKRIDCQVYDEYAQAMGY